MSQGESDGHRANRTSDRAGHCRHSVWHGRIAKLGGELGQGLREFRKGMSGEDEALARALPETSKPAADAAAQTDAAAKS